eukprot:1961907-Rhodomonas_salina.1
MAWGHRCRWSPRMTQGLVSANNKQSTLNLVDAQDPAMGIRNPNFRIYDNTYSTGVFRNSTVLLH